MSTTLKILVPPVPPHNDDAYAFAHALARVSAELPPAPRLVQFHDALTARYPCWSSGAYPATAGRARCPWTAAPLIGCFRGDMGIIGIATLNPDLVPFVLRRAGIFALTVIDEAEGKVYRPATFRVVFSGVQKHVNMNAMVTKLMPLFKASRDDVLAAIGTPNSLLKCRLDYVTATRFAATMDLLGCDCIVEKEAPLDGSAAAASGAARPALAHCAVDASDSKARDSAGQPSPSWLARMLGRDGAPRT